VTTGLTNDAALTCAASRGLRSLFTFAGIWTESNGDRGTQSKSLPGPRLVYGFLTELRRRADPSEGHDSDADH
jgi:hypothetical protein